MRLCANIWRRLRGNNFFEPPRREDAKNTNLKTLASLRLGGFNFIRDLRPFTRYLPPMYFLIGGDGKEYGPKSAADVREWIAEGRLNAQSQIKRQAETDWVQLGSLQEFAADLNPPTAAPGPLPPPQPPASYAAPPPAYATVPQQPATNPMAITGMICGILSLPMLCCCYGLPFNILGIVFSIVGLSQIKANPQQEGKGMAIAGLICSILSFLLIGILIALGIAIGIMNP